jgi:hypothetical protein
MIATTDAVTVVLLAVFFWSRRSDRKPKLGSGEVVDVCGACTPFGSGLEARWLTSVVEGTEMTARQRIAVAEQLRRAAWSTQFPRPQHSARFTGGYVNTLRRPSCGADTVAA